MIALTAARFLLGGRSHNIWGKGADLGATFECLLRLPYVNEPQRRWHNTAEHSFATGNGSNEDNLSTGLGPGHESQRPFTAPRAARLGHRSRSIAVDVR